MTLSLSRKSCTTASAIIFLAVFPVSCDTSRVFEDNREFSGRIWNTPDTVRFDFTIDDSVRTYSLYYNIRNSIDYPFARIFVMYALSDSLGHELSGKLLNNDLFDQKTGRPFGESGVGDIYDHRFPFLQHYRFAGTGKYSVTLTQFMRQDTLKGVLAVGLRVEKDPDQ